MALFNDSTQATYWTLREDELTARREAVATRLQPRSHAIGTPHLTPPEEAALRAVHQRRIVQLTATNRNWEKVAATALCYFQRFYIDRSVVEFSPSVIALSSLYVAFKVEEVHMPVDDLIALSIATIPRHAILRDVNAQALLKTEIDFLDRLRFHLVCYHPFRSAGLLRHVVQQRALWGCEKETPTESPLLAKVADAAHALVMTDILATDLPLMCSPAVLAIAAVVVAAVDAGAEEDDVAAALVVLEAAGANGKPVLVDGVMSAIKMVRHGVADKYQHDQLVQMESRRQRLAMLENDPMSKEFRNDDDDDELESDKRVRDDDSDQGNDTAAKRHKPNEE